MNFNQITLIEVKIIINRLNQRVKKVIRKHSIKRLKLNKNVISKYMIIVNTNGENTPPSQKLCCIIS